MNWSIVSAVNNEEVLRSCLLASPDLEQDVELIVEKGHPNAASAYNSGMKRASADHIIFAHQDMYFPKGWLDRVECAMHALESQDPNWGVLGAWGTACDGSGEMYGHLYDGGWRRTLGGPYAGGQQVEALDEVVLILRKSSGLQFDTSLPGFHFYGADICLEARSRGMKCYAISALCIHNTNSYGMLPLEFWKCYWLMRRKWRARRGKRRAALAARRRRRSTG